MTLFHYDHCPYCVKARMIFGFKNIPMELKALANDDEATPIRLIGKKVLPILIRQDGSALSESLDIIAYSDSLKDFGGRRIQKSPNDGDLNRWMSQAREFHYALAMPRWVQMGLPEFQTESAVAYFTGKKILSIGPFAEALEKTPELIEKANTALQKLETMYSFNTYLQGELSLDDFHLFATLRVLTTVKGLSFPAKINAYMERLSKESQVELHWDRAL